MAGTFDKFWRRAKFVAQMATRATLVSGTFLSNPERWAVEMFHGMIPGVGLYVDEMTAMRLSTVYSCIRLIAETVGTLPLPTFRTDAAGNASLPLRNNYVGSLLHDQPNDLMTASVFREVLQGHVSGWGNGYAEIVYNGAGKVAELWPLPAHAMKIEVQGARSIQYVLTAGGKRKIFQPEQIFHVPGLGYDGFKGYSPIQLARRNLAFALGQEEHGIRFYENDARPGIVLEHPQKLGDKAYNRLTEFLKGQTGVFNSFKPMIAEEGMKLKEVSVSHADAQFIESRKFQVIEICRLFRVPPHFVFDLERATFSNIEQQSLEFVIYCLRPHLVKFEQEAKRKLFGVNSDLYCEHNVEGLLRGDYKTRMEGHGIAIERGIYTRNQARKIENLPPHPADQRGDEIMVPTNMRFVKDPIPVASAGGGFGAAADNKKTNGSEGAVYGE